MQAYRARYEKVAELALKSQRYIGIRFAHGKEEATLTELLLSGQIAAEARVQAYKSRYEMLLALIALERHTVGGFCAGLDRVPVIPPPPPGTMTEEERRQLEKELKLATQVTTSVKPARMVEVPFRTRRAACPCAGLCASSPGRPPRARSARRAVLLARRLAALCCWPRPRPRSRR